MCGHVVGAARARIRDRPPEGRQRRAEADDAELRSALRGGLELPPDHRFWTLQVELGMTVAGQASSTSRSFGSRA